ncbi:alpha/beta hydrolase [Sphingobium aromaticivastans]|uniref:alpha/beta hydrolase n=1 Tax=Sphingobium aromaticivastans TaxID=1778665 RepID=UPI003015A0B7
MSNPQDFFIDGPNGRLSIRTKGLEAKPERVVLMVHASNITGQLAFDFSYPGGRDYSTMDAMVAAGFGAITFSLSGYGLSDPPADLLAYDTEAAIRDLDAITAWLSEQGWPRFHLLGWSWGGRIAGHYAARHPDQVERLILMDAALGGNAPVPPVPGPDEGWWLNRTVDYLKRLEPEYTEAEGHRIFAEMVEQVSPRAPNGIRMENALGKTVAVEPAELSMPVLMLYGHAAARAPYMRGKYSRQDFFEMIPAEDKQFVIVPRSSDYGHLQGTRHLFHRAMVDFLALSDAYIPVIDPVEA